MSSLRRLLAAGLCVAVSCTTAVGAISNGGFDNGLTDWVVSGYVVASGGQAVLGDTGFSHSVLYQILSWPANALTLDFEFRNLLSDAVPEGGFPDGFFASLYFVNDPGTFDLAGKVYENAVALFDMDAAGTYNSIGTIGAGDKGAEWLHFSATIPSLYPYVVPVFEVFDLNRQAADSLVLMDDVSITPEPSSLSIFLLGTVLVSWLRLTSRRWLR